MCEGGADMQTQAQLTILNTTIPSHQTVTCADGISTISVHSLLPPASHLHFMFASCHSSLLLACTAQQRRKQAGVWTMLHDVFGDANNNEYNELASLQDPRSSRPLDSSGLFPKTLLCDPLNKVHGTPEKSPKQVGGGREATPPAHLNDPHHIAAPQPQLAAGWLAAVV
ncbi:hypothetical protein B0H17DRAFT_1124920 [Mycena rosella]|uniref:Uncharacterized protein n=1 Tax=Mycena rosella TaxID=1033263 RepID=A0AAD7MAH8_MYCRO|nr:hypothetical protein B0H17DRAFT_1124920 [Mycena rosella]